MNQRNSRIIIAIFIGVALLLAATTIIGTYSRLNEPPSPASPPS